MAFSLGTETTRYGYVQSYQEVEHLVRRINMDHHFEVPDDIHHAGEKFQTDNMAKHFYPTDAPQEMTQLLVLYFLVLILVMVLLLTRKGMTCLVDCVIHNVLQVCLG